MAAVTFLSDFGAQENKVCHCFCCFPIYLPWSDGARCMIFIIWMLSFKPTFSLSSFTFIKRLFHSSLSAIRVVSSAYLRLLIFLMAMLTPACASSSPAFYMMYSSYTLNKQGEHILDVLFPNLYPVHFSMSGSRCCFLTYNQISQEAAKMVCYSHFFKNFPQFAWSTQSNTLA